MSKQEQDRRSPPPDWLLFVLGIVLASAFGFWPDADDSLRRKNAAH